MDSEAQSMHISDTTRTNYEAGRAKGPGLHNALLARTNVMVREVDAQKHRCPWKQITCLACTATASLTKTS